MIPLDAGVTILPLDIIPEIILVIVIIFLVLWFFQDALSFKKGMSYGPYEILLKSTSEGFYERKRRSLSDVTTTITYGYNIAMEGFRFWAEQEDCPLDPTVKHLFLNVVKGQNPMLQLKELGLDVKIMVANSLLADTFLMYVLYQFKHYDFRGSEITKSFPDDHALPGRRRTMTLMARRLIEGHSFRMPYKLRFADLSRRKLPVYIFVPDTDAKSPTVSEAIEKVGPALVTFTQAIPSERQHGAEIKSLNEINKKIRLELLQLHKEKKDEAGSAFEDSETAIAIDRFLKKDTKGPRRLGGLATMAMVSSPFLGALFFQFAFNLNPILGTLVGTALGFAIFMKR